MKGLNPILWGLPTSYFAPATVMYANYLGWSFTVYVFFQLFAVYLRFRRPSRDLETPRGGRGRSCLAEDEHRRGNGHSDHLHDAVRDMLAAVKLLQPAPLASVEPGSPVAAKPVGAVEVTTAASYTG